VPTYEYKCKKCGNTFEKFQSMSDEPLKKCPECDGKVKKLIGIGGGVIYKGGGFYTTEYRSDEYKKREKAEKETPSTSSTSSACSTCPLKKDSTCKK